MLGSLSPRTASTGTMPVFSASPICSPSIILMSQFVTSSSPAAPRDASSCPPFEVTNCDFKTFPPTLRQ